jgi:hypothetical protein
MGRSCMRTCSADAGSRNAHSMLANDGSVR